MLNLQSITGMQHLNTANVTIMSYMFDRCSNMTSFDVSSFNTSEVTTMESMFGYCSSLTSLDLGGFNTANVTNMMYMFENCRSLTSLDLSSFNTAKVDEMYRMFYNCTGLITVYAGDGWNTDAVIYSNNMFKNCAYLVGGNATTYDASHVDKTYAHIDGGPSNPGYFTAKPALLRGDVNGNGSVNMDDLTVLNNFLLTYNYDLISYENAAVCDNLNSTTVGMDDLTALINYLLTNRWQSQSFTVNGVSFKMVPVEGGTFTMGATEEQSGAQSNESPSHQVTLSNYYMGETEETQELWLAVMGTNPSYYTGDLSRPVERVSWNDCQTFITQLNALTGQQFRLPTEAEWEYAARGGKLAHGFMYSGNSNIDMVAWYNGNSSSQTHPVAEKLANELGLYDMSGNVWEWCQDWYGNYNSEAQTNPTGPETSLYRVLRSGSWFNGAANCRVSYRVSHAPSYTQNCLGLRLAL